MKKEPQFDPKDFLEFQKETSFPSRPPSEVSNRILRRVRQDLNPSAWRVFAKISMVHFFVGLLTLLVCPQFGVRLMGSEHGLMGSFMSLGPYGCMLACGSLFLGLSLLVASIFLQPEELRQLKKNAILEVSTLALLSLGFFIMVGAKEIVFGFAAAWLFGSLMTGLALIEIVFAIRSKV